MFENTTIEDADKEALELANEIIKDYHEHLIPAKIKYLFKEQATKSGAIRVAGTAKKTDATLKYMTGYDFIITLAYDIWSILSDGQQKALVDHELYHCFVSESGTELKWVIRKHDFEDFLEIVARHGDNALSMAGFFEIVKESNEKKKATKDEVQGKDK